MGSGAPPSLTIVPASRTNSYFHRQVVRDVGSLPPDAECDHLVGVTAEELSAPLDLLSLRSPGSGVLEAREQLTISGLQGPMSLALSREGELLVVCRGEGGVRRYSREGKFLGRLVPGRKFDKPSDVLVLSSGLVAVRDELGIQLFGATGEFLKSLGRDTDRCFGLAEDEEGRLVTINWNEGGKAAHVTRPGQTDVFFIDVGKDKVVKRMELEDVVKEVKRTQLEDGVEVQQSKCRYTGPKAINQTLI